ncbi:MAG TPA: cytochrome c [Polyangia bacterium]|jgi:cytochrome c2|nr:cytochrome c [Polyangia bacterium]
MNSNHFADVGARRRDDGGVRGSVDATIGRLLGVIVCAVVAVAGAPAIARAADGTDAKKIFNQRCTACHTFGHGVKVGPDLKGVAQRRSHSWLSKFIRSSQSLISAGDPTARALFSQFQQQRMPDWSELGDAQITAIVKWLADNGPEQKEPDERNADQATAADIERARLLFQGRVALNNGGLACAACHAIEEDGRKSGGTLGPDLTTAYVRYRDRALTLFLKNPCSPRLPESWTRTYLMPDESFALKAYLRHAAMDGVTATAGRVETP